MDSKQIAKEWEAANPERCKELNDALDACPDPESKRALYATFTDEEKNGVMLEVVRRKTNKLAPTGALVKPKHPKKGIPFIVGRGSNSVMHGSHFELAMVLGYRYGSNFRHLMLLPPWRNLERQKVMFCEGHVEDLEVVG